MSAKPLSGSARKGIILLCSLGIIGATTLLFQATQSLYKVEVRGKRLFMQSRFAQALPFFQKAHQLAPHRRDLGLYLVWTYERLNRPEASYQVLNTLWQKAPEDPDLAEHLADNAFRLNIHDQAEKLYRDILSVRPSLKVKEKLADVLLSQKKYAEALPEWQALAEADPSDDRRQRVLAETFSQTGDHLAAAGVYDRLLLKSGRDTNLKLRRVQALLAGGATEQAQAAVEQYLQEDPLNVELTLILCDLYSKEEKWEQAIKLYQGLVKTRRANKQTVLKLANVLRYAGRDEEAVAVYQSYLQDSAP